MGRKPNTQCSECSKPLYRRPFDLARYEESYCSECRKTGQAKGVAKMVKTRHRQYIELWLANKIDGTQVGGKTSAHIKKHLMLFYHNSCQKCKWSERNDFTGRIPLAVHHKDGNCTNNRPENLELLCPNCHSLTSTFCGANKGNSKRYRSK